MADIPEVQDEFRPPQGSAKLSEVFAWGEASEERDIPGHPGSFRGDVEEAVQDAEGGSLRFSEILLTGSNGKDVGRGAG